MQFYQRITNKRGYSLKPYSKKYKGEDDFTKCLIKWSFTKYSSCQVPNNRRGYNKAAIITKGGLGPSGMEANGWRWILASNNFRAPSSDLHDAFANVQKLWTDFVEIHTMEASLSCPLIPLDKSPGLRLFGIGEVLRRIASKVNCLSSERRCH